MLFQKPACDWLVVGLGNPGENYARTRHNVGFRTLDAIAASLGASVTRAKFRGLTAQATYAGQKLLLLKPQTFMNNSGLSVMDAARFYRLPPERVLVLFDDISLDVGRLRVRADGSAGGHNGMKNIIYLSGSDQFPRIKIGVGHKPHPDYDLADWVLSTFSKEERAALDSVAKRVCLALHLMVQENFQLAMSKYNG